jgi:hypothetical protein
LTVKGLNTNISRNGEGLLAKSLPFHPHGVEDLNLAKYPEI